MSTATLHTEKKKTLVPKLRFQEFEGEFVYRKLGDVCNITMGQSPDSKSYNENGEGYYLIQGNADIKNRVSSPRQWTSMPTKICEIGDIILTVRAPVGAIAKSNHNACIGRGVCVIRNLVNYDLEYIYQFLLNFETKWGKLEQGSTFTAVSGADIKSIKSAFPTLSEQQKIATFLSSVDEKIQQLSRKKELLEQYKKGVMQQLFSGKLRFKDENGKNYADWEEKMLGDIGETYNGLTGKTKEDFGNGKPYVQYKQIFNDSRIDISRFELVNIGADEKQKKVVFGDVFFTVSSETPNEIGTASVLLDQIDELYLNSFCFGYRANSLELLSPYFSRYLFRCELFRNEIVKLAQGSTRYNMSKVQLMKLKIQLPCLQEQQKIADFLSNIDVKIETVTGEIGKMQLFKKGLLQQLFV